MESFDAMRGFISVYHTFLSDIATILLLNLMPLKTQDGNGRSTMSR
jgi:hypothetical protein